MTTYQFDQSILDSLPPLTSGSHKDTDDAVCAMEAAARACGLGTTDHPECTCHVLAAFVRSLNDGLADNASRDRIIRPLIPLMVGTADDGHTEERMWLCADRSVRVFAADALEAAGLSNEAKTLRSLAPIRDIESAESAAWAARSAESAAENEEAIISTLRELCMVGKSEKP